ncbi:MAG: protein-disulfide reductase DsbD family protein [Gammaproteobacteria bacterium]
MTACLLPPQRVSVSLVVRLAVVLLAALFIAAASAQSLLNRGAGSAVSQTEQVRSELMVHAPAGVDAGRTVWVGLQLTHAPEWHSYWKNPGDSGLPTELHWTLPAGVTAGDIAWPTPRKFPLGNLANYGYDNTVLLPVPLTIAPSFQATSLDIGLEASWLACRKECIPEEASLRLSVPVEGSTSVHGALFDAALAAVPAALAAGDGRADPEQGFLRVNLGGLPSAWHGQSLEFFPETPGLIEPGAPWTQSWEGGRWSARVPLAPHRSESPAELPLVLARADGGASGEAGVRTVLTVQGAWPAVAALPAANEVSPALQAALEANAARSAVGPAPASGLTLGAALIGALIGGLILNLMPCVFPVLAIKVLAFARHADDRAAHRRNGLAYTAGVVLSFLALGGLLLGLRAAGEAIGWGFQLQDPVVVAALAVLFTLIGLNLAGMFEFGQMLPGNLAAYQARHPTVDAFLTGVLAVAVASPCTAPFMGASLGLAVGLPIWQALSVFALLGLGMALPYLLASWWPAVARLLPRPGAWMQTFRQLMAFPMFATVVWLLWVLGQQTGIDGAAALLMLLVALALLVWALNLRGRSRLMLGALSAAGLLWLGMAVGSHVTSMLPADTAVPASGPGANIWEPWSQARQDALVAEGRTVFVDYTAAWCVTCQYNKRTTLADPGLLDEMAARQIALLRADWTRRDPAVTAALAALGRNGVPVYALHRNGQPPVVLSEVLSVEEVRAALAGL